MSDLKQELKDLMEEQGLNLSAVSRALGYKQPAKLSLWLSDSYMGNVTKIQNDVKSFLKRQKERLKTPKKPIKFVMTSVAQKVFEVARVCHLDAEIGVCYGPAGLGKTLAIKVYTEKNPDVILIEADLGYVARVLFSELHKRLGMDGRGSIHDMFEDIITKLKDSGRLIIVDEAENLPFKALELLRRVYDKADVGILLVGMPRLIANLRGKKGEFAQLHSRIGIAGRLEGLKAYDTREIVSSVISSKNGIWKTFHEESHGNTRILCKLLLRAPRISELNNTLITPEIVRETAKMLII